MQTEIYIPLNINDYNNFYYNKNLSIIYATDDFNSSNCAIIDINNHYTTIFSSTCDNTLYFTEIDKSNLTNSNLYRKDITEVSIFVFIMSIFLFLIPVYIFSRLFKRGLR